MRPMRICCCVSARLSLSPSSSMILSQGFEMVVSIKGR